MNFFFNMNVYTILDFLPALFKNQRDDKTYFSY